MRLKTFVVHALFLSLGPVFLFTGSEAGTTGVPFLSLGVGARALSMGEAAVANATDASAIYWNPAGLRSIQRRSVVFMHSAQMEDTSFDFAAFGSRSGESAWGASLQYYSPGDVPQTDLLGNPIGSISPNDIAIAGGYARRIRGFDVGLSAKYIQSKLVETAKILALDAGVLSPGLWGDRVKAGVSVANLGGRVKYDQVSSPLPLVLRTGILAVPRKGWSVAADAVFPRGEDAYPVLGGEYMFAALEKVELAIRAGYNGESSSGGGADGFAAGVGFLWSGLSVDYAFVSQGDLDPSQVISIGYAF
jgi:hypothetical protein